MRQSERCKIARATSPNVVEEYVSREGTDYGEREISHETKVEQVLRLLHDGKMKVVFDAETESVDLREVPHH